MPVPLMWLANAAFPLTLGTEQVSSYVEADLVQITGIGARCGLALVCTANANGDNSPLWGFYGLTIAEVGTGNTFQLFLQRIQFGSTPFNASQVILSDFGGKFVTLPMHFRLEARFSLPAAGGGQWGLKTYVNGVVVRPDPGDIEFLDTTRASVNGVPGLYSRTSSRPIAGGAGIEAFQNFSAGQLLP
jgi:hypothetical protein